MNCCTLKCARLRPRDKRPVVWKVGKNYYCNVCFLNDLEAERFAIDETIVRLFDDDQLYYDIRTQKRRRRTPPESHGVRAQAHA